MQLNVFGKLAQNQWERLPQFFQHIELDVFQFMPNHVHGIIVIKNRPDDVAVGAKKPEQNQCILNVCVMHSGTNVGEKHPEQDQFNMNAGVMHPLGTIENNNKNHARDASPLQKKIKGTKPGSIGAIVQNFCSITTRKINRIRKTLGFKFWQANYFEHIIRGDNELTRIQDYIEGNPNNWIKDEYYTKN